MGTKLKVFKVDEFTFWCDYSKKEAHDNYKQFCIDEDVLSENEADEFISDEPDEFSERQLLSYYCQTSLGAGTFKEELEKRDKPGLFYVEDFI